MNSYTIVFAAFLIAAGRWSDTFGRKRSYLLGTGLFVTASAACALAPSIPFLVAARAVQGLGAALLMPASLGLLLPEFPPEKRHIPIGIWAAVGGIAAAAGPPLGGLLVQVELALGVHRQRPRRPGEPDRRLAHPARGSPPGRRAGPTSSARAC